MMSGPSFQALTGIGGVQMDTGDFAGAEMTFSQAVAATPPCPTCRSDLASAQASQGKEAQALATLRQVIGDEPGQDADYSAVVDVYGRLGKSGDARPILDRALEKFPESGAALKALTSLTHDFLFDFSVAYEGDGKLLKADQNNLSRKADYAEAAFTASHYDVALQTALDALKTEDDRIQRRLTMDIIAVGSLLATNQAERAISQLEVFLSAYRRTPDDWKRELAVLRA